MLQRLDGSDCDPLRLRQCALSRPILQERIRCMAKISLTLESSFFVFPFWAFFFLFYEGVYVVFFFFAGVWWDFSVLRGGDRAVCGGC